MTVTTPPPRERAPQSPPPAPGRAPSLFDSFNYAFEGIIHVLRTQRNLRIHFVIAIVVIGAAGALGVGRDDLILLLMAIAFVLVAEMVNSAIEGAIDVSTTSFDPNAKLAKDIAAGAVLIAAVTAIAVGYLVFAHAIAHRSARVLDRVRDAPAEITLVALVLVVLIVIATKALTRSGTPLRGGLPVRPRGHRIRGLDGRDVRLRRPPPIPHLLAHVRARASRRADARRGRRALAARGAVRRRDRRARHSRRLPGADVTGEELVERAREVATARTRRTRSTTSARPSLTTDGRVFDGVNVENAAYPLGVCAEKSALAAAATAGVRPGEVAAIGITASPCGGCRQWLHEWRIPLVAFRRADGTLAEYAADELLPDTWDLPE